VPFVPAGSAPPPDLGLDPGPIAKGSRPGLRSLCQSASRSGRNAAKDRSGGRRQRSQLASNSAARRWPDFGHPWPRWVPCLTVVRRSCPHSRQRHDTLGIDPCPIVSGSTSPLRSGCHSADRAGWRAASERSRRARSRQLGSRGLHIGCGCCCASRAPHSRQRHDTSRADLTPSVYGSRPKPSSARSWHWTGPCSLRIRPSGA
jgi:hypothetical protein